MQELVYLDHLRLLNLLRATGGIPRSWNVEGELSASPKVTLSSGGPISKAECIDTMVARLDDHSWIGTSRPASPGPTSEVIRELTLAQKFTVPSLRHAQHTSPGFNFWISYSEWMQKRIASLCLLEGYRGEEGKPIDMWPFSTYSCLMSLVYYARDEVNQSVLAANIPDDTHSFAEEIATKKTPSLTQYDNVKHIAWEFATQTESLLESLGCFASQPRKVDVLYAVREYGYEGGMPDAPFAVFGYPIWIRDAGID
jgi:hypothetical protein